MLHDGFKEHQMLRFVGNGNMFGRTSENLVRRAQILSGGLHKRGNRFDTKSMMTQVKEYL